MLGGARAPAAAAAGSRAGRRRPGRAAHCYPSARPRAGVRAALPPRPGPGGRDKETVPERPPAPALPAAAGNPGAKMVCGGFACSKNCLCALNLLYTVSSRSPRRRPGALHLPAAGSQAPLPGPRVPSFPPRPLAVFPRFTRGGPRPRPPTAARRWPQPPPSPRGAALSPPRPSPTAGSFGHPTGPFGHSLPASPPSEAGPGGWRAAWGLRTVVQNSVTRK